MNMSYTLISFRGGKSFDANISGMSAVREALGEEGVDFQQAQKRWTLDDFSEGGTCEKCKSTITKATPTGPSISLGEVLSVNDGYLVTQKESAYLATIAHKWLVAHPRSEDKGLMKEFYQFVKAASTRGGFFVI